MKIRYLFYIFAASLLAGLLAAQEPAKPTTAPAATAAPPPPTALTASAAPAIPDPLKIRFYESQTALQEAQQNYQAVIAELTRACGERFQIQMVKGKLVCEVKPVEPAATKPAAAVPPPH